MTIDKEHRPFLLEWSGEHFDKIETMDISSQRLLEFAIQTLLNTYHGDLFIEQEEIDGYFMDMCGAIDIFQVMVYSEEVLKYYNEASDIISRGNSVMILYDVTDDYPVLTLLQQLSQDAKEGETFIKIKKFGRLNKIQFDE